MKRILAGALAVIMFGTAANAKGGKDVEPVKQFRKDFKTVANEKWSSDADFYYVSFVKNGELNSAVYEKDTKELIGVARLKDNAYLPASVNKLLQKEFEDYTLTGKFIEINYADTDAYVVSLENKKEILTLRIDDRGDFIKIKTMKKI